MTPQILAQNADYWIIDKPSGYSVHNEIPSLKGFFKDQPSLHFVNRLDRETSGLVVATTDASKVKDLVAALHAETAVGSQKLYRGIVSRPRDMKDVGPGQKWMWSDPISDKSEGRKNPTGLKKDRVAATTEVQVIRGNDYYFELEFNLVTGRQHQIRKHCAIHQMPLVNDHRYGRETLNSKTLELYKVSRMMLHAFQLKMEWAGVSLQFTAPLPTEFETLFAGSVATPAPS